MPNANLVILIGNLGKDSEMRFLASGLPSTSFSIAVNRRVKRDDAWQDQTDWFKIITFGKTAEFCNQYLSKGNPVYIQGKLQTRTYEKEGVTKYVTEIIADKVQSLKPETKEIDENKEVESSDIPF